MRIVIDMQGAQTGSRFRGIGRYTLSLVEAILKHKQEHEVILLMMDLEDETILTIKNTFSKNLLHQNMKVCYFPKPVYEQDQNNAWRRRTAERVRENYLLNLKPDFVLLTTFFEGFGENFLASINEIHKIPTAMIFYDLIPLMNEKEYLSDKFVKAWYMNKVRQCKKAKLLLTISESARKEALNYLTMKEEQVINISTASDGRFKSIDYTKKEVEEIKNKFQISKNYLMYSGATDDRKNHLRLIEAYSLLPDNIRKLHQLVFVGGMPKETKENFLLQAKKYHLSYQELIITGKVTDKEMNLLYNLCTAFIFPSWHEGFGLPALEAMQCKKAVIASNTSSLPEVIGRDDALFDPFDVNDISAKIKLVLSDAKFRTTLEHHSISQSAKFSWDITAKKAISAMEKYHLKNPTINYDINNYNTLIKSIAKIPCKYTDNDIIITAQSIYKNNSKQKLFVDISELVKYDNATGIQRVVKSCLNYLIKYNLEDYQIQPIYQDDRGDYRYANDYINTKNISKDDTLISYSSNDIYFCLDLLHPNLISDNINFFLKLKQRGVLIVFLVYDILPIQFPLYANKGVAEGHISWLKNIIQLSNKIVCISNTVMHDVKKWVEINNLNQNNNFIQYTHFNLGADIDKSLPSKGLPSDIKNILNKIKSTHSFLMVGTIEPRKSHKQTIEAFERLWENNIAVNLIIVGKEGWLVDDLVHKLKNHPELNKKLLWLEGISDEYLEKIYESSTCLIASSEGEGFGLPLIEAAQKKIPILARDIPVFKEVAGEYAYYFKNSKEPKVIEQAVKEWLDLYKEDNHPKSDDMPWLTWEESTKQLLQCLNIEIHSNT